MVTGAANTAWSGPWGVSFTANMAPDKETGLGDWAAQDFKATIRSGGHTGRGRQTLPPTPWPVYANLTNDDLESMILYLRTVPAIQKRVPEP